MARIGKQQEFSQTPQQGFVIHQRISEAARLFTQQILHILGSSTLAELTALTQGVPQPPPQPQVAEQPVHRGPGRPRKDGRPPGSAPPEKKKVLDFLLDIGKLPVQCPVPGCTTKGVRSKNNFCTPHYDTLPKEELARLRDLQKKGHTPVRANRVATRGRG